MEEFADNLKRLRKERGMNQKQLANMSCIPLKTIQNYEQNRGGNAPTLHNLMVLADIFNVTPYYLLYGGNKEMKAQSVYMNELLSELSQLDMEAIEEIHRSKLEGTSLPKLMLTDSFIEDLAKKWNKDIQRPERGIYKSYIEGTVGRYAQNRQVWKKKFDIK